MPSPAIAPYASRVSEYVRGRPEYPLAALAELPPADTIIELGAGTGKFTELLASTGKRILVVEPLPEMAARIPVGGLANVEVKIGTAEAIPLPSHAAGLVCCATSFHWFDYERATGEIIRVLERGGALALLWNMRDVRVPWVAAFSALLESYASEQLPRQAHGKWRAIFDDTRFEHQKSWSLPFTQQMPASGIVDRALSASVIAKLPPDELKIARAKVQGIIDNEPLLAGRGLVEFPYVTELYVFRVRS